jgi:hypothetical protein
VAVAGEITRRIGGDPSRTPVSAAGRTDAG